MPTAISGFAMISQNSIKLTYYRIPGLCLKLDPPKYAYRGHVLGKCLKG